MGALDAAETTPAAATLRAHSDQLLRLHPGATVVDVGCGTDRADTIPHPRIARAYRNLLLDNGFHDVEVEVHTAIFIDATMQPLLAGHADAARPTSAISGEQAEAWVTPAAGGCSPSPMFLAAATR